MQAAVATPPMRIWPSAPMFQNRIWKAGARPTAMHSRKAVSLTVTQVRFRVPKAPFQMEP